MSRRLYRDYYDIYSILKEKYHLDNIVLQAAKYSGHRFKTKSIYAIISNGANFIKEKDFQLLRPKYTVTSQEIENEIVSCIKRENSDIPGV